MPQAAAVRLLFILCKTRAHQWKKFARRAAFLPFREGIANVRLSAADPPSRTDLKTIATFTKAEDAHLLRMRLGAGGVEAYVQNENVFQNEGFGVYNGGVLVQIADEDVEAAREILAALPMAEDEREAF